MGMQEGHSASETALAINQAYQDIVDSFINKVSCKKIQTISPAESLLKKNITNVILGWSYANASARKANRYPGEFDRSHIFRVWHKNLYKSMQSFVLNWIAFENETSEFVQVPVLQFLTPYFHDLSKMGAPPNRDAQQKIKDEENDALVTPAKKWFKQETEKLRDGLIEMVLERLMRPAMNRREIFVEKLKTTPEDEVSFAALI